MKKKSTVFILAAAFVAGQAFAATAFTGGVLQDSNNWNNGLPTTADSGTVATVGTLDGSAFTAYGTVDQNADLTGESFNLAATSGETLTWNLQSGTIEAKNIAVGEGVTLNATGGLIKTASGASTPVVGGTINLAHDASIDTSTISLGFTSGHANMLNFAQDWIGSITLSANNAHYWGYLVAALADPSLMPGI